MERPPPRPPWPPANKIHVTSRPAGQGVHTVTPKSTQTKKPDNNSIPTKVVLNCFGLLNRLCIFSIKKNTQLVCDIAKLKSAINLYKWIVHYLENAFINEATFS